jgi:hypothetical protein
MRDGLRIPWCAYWEISLTQLWLAWGSDIPLTAVSTAFTWLSTEYHDAVRCGVQVNLQWDEQLRIDWTRAPKEAWKSLSLPGLEVGGQNKLSLGLTDEKTRTPNDAFGCSPYHQLDEFWLLYDFDDSSKPQRFVYSPLESCNRAWTTPIWARKSSWQGHDWTTERHGVRAHCRLRSFSLLGADTATSNKFK